MNKYFIRSFSIENNELYHHGIKGQKWGERNGPPYPLDTKTHREVVNSKEYKKDKNINEEEKDKGNFINKATLKKIAIGAGVATALVGAGVLTTYAIKNGKINTRLEPFRTITLGKPMDLDELSDKSTTLKKGTVLQRVSSSKTEDYVKGGSKEVNRIFAAYDNFDIAKYRNRLSKDASGYGEDAKWYIHKYTLDKDVKVASEKELAQSITRLLTSHADYQPTLRSRIGLKNSTSNQIDKGKYDDFMSVVFSSNEEWTKDFIYDLKRELFNTHSANAIFDPNDYGHYSKNPLIILDPAEAMGVKTSTGKKLTSFDKFISVIKS